VKAGKKEGMKIGVLEDSKMKGRLIGEEMKEGEKGGRE